jgi:hypothetical protein
MLRSHGVCLFRSLFGKHQEQERAVKEGLNVVPLSPWEAKRAGSPQRSLSESSVRCCQASQVYD